MREQLATWSLLYWGIAVSTIGFGVIICGAMPCAPEAMSYVLVVSLLSVIGYVALLFWAFRNQPK